MRADVTLLVIDLCQLGLITLILLPTEVLGEHPDEPAAVVLYAVVLGRRFGSIDRRPVGG